MTSAPAVVALDEVRYVTNPTVDADIVRSYAIRIQTQARRRVVLVRSLSAVGVVAILGVVANMWADAPVRSFGNSLVAVIIAAGGSFVFSMTGAHVGTTIANVLWRDAHRPDMSLLIPSRYMWRGVTESVGESAFASVAHHALWDAVSADSRISQLACEMVLWKFGSMKRDALRGALESLERLKAARAGAIRLVVGLTGVPAEDPGASGDPLRDLFGSPVA